MHLADAFIPSDLDSGYTVFFISMCVPWESNPQTFAQLTQCSTTELQEYIVVLWSCIGYCDVIIAVIIPI